jgi:hypothetical protein
MSAYQLFVGKYTFSLPSSLDILTFINLVVYFKKIVMPWRKPDHISRAQLLTGRTILM